MVQNAQSDRTCGCAGSNHPADGNPQGDRHAANTTAAVAVLSQATPRDCCAGHGAQRPERALRLGSGSPRVRPRRDPVSRTRSIAYTSWPPHCRCRPLAGLRHARAYSSLVHFSLDSSYACRALPARRRATALDRLGVKARLWSGGTKKESPRCSNTVGLSSS